MRQPLEPRSPRRGSNRAPLASALVLGAVATLAAPLLLAPVGSAEPTHGQDAQDPGSLDTPNLFPGTVFH